MANYCSNSVLFLGDRESVAAVRDLFVKIELHQHMTDTYHLPDFVKAEDGCMWDIYDSEGWLNYETRWSPNLEVLEQIAEKYNVNFICHYAEMMSGIWGEAVYHNGKLTSVDRNKYDKQASPDHELNALRQDQKYLINKFLFSGNDLLER